MESKFPMMLWKIENGFLERYKFSAMVGGTERSAFYLKDDLFPIIVHEELINMGVVFDNPEKGYKEIKNDLEHRIKIINSELKRYANKEKK